MADGIDPIGKPSSAAAKDKGSASLPVRFDRTGRSLTYDSGSKTELFVLKNGNWYSVMDFDEQYPYKLSDESRGKIYYLVPGKYGHFPGIAGAADDGSGHPVELQPLIQSIRRYQQQARDFVDSTRGTRAIDPAKPTLPDKAGLPKGLPLLAGGGSTYIYEYPNYVFINRGGKIYYRHKDSAPTRWRSTAEGEDTKIFELKGGTGTSGDRSYMVEVSTGSRGTTKNTRTTDTYTASTDSTARVDTPSRSRIPPRAGDPVGFSPTDGQKPLHVETFDTDLTTLSFQVRRNARNRNVSVGFKPQLSTSRDMFEDRRSAHQDLWDAGIRVTPQFAEEATQGRGGGRGRSVYRLTGYRVEFYRPGSYQATTRQNYYTWYSLDSGRRAANAASYPTEDTPIKVEEK